jgi:eukaryotic-like serine/threonine-protein kinase
MPSASNETLTALADYRLLQLLGHGSHGDVYLADPPSRLDLTQSQVAVKVLPKGPSEDGFRRAIRELRLFAAASSPYLVNVYDAGQVGDYFYYSLEYFPMSSLASPTTAPSRTESLRAVAHAALGADALHETGIVHRDIRPANIMLFEHGAKLADLGMAQLLSPGFTMTSTGPVATAEYIDPDLIRGGAPSRASDIWSLGVTLHWVLTGAGVYGDLRADEPVLTLRHLLTSTPQLDPRLAENEAALVLSCLEPDPRDRPATARDVAAAVNALGAARESLP